MVIQIYFVSKGQSIVTISLVNISVQWLQYLVSKMEFTV